MAYGSLFQERRRLLLLASSRPSNASVPDHLAEQIERLAHHALRGELWEKAIIYYKRAEKAMVRSAYREALGYFEQALAALEH